MYREEKLAEMEGKMVLTFVDEYRAIPGTVDFDRPVKEDTFVIRLPPGTPVLDLRSDPPVETLIPAGKDVFEEQARKVGEE